MTTGIAVGMRFEVQKGALAGALSTVGNAVSPRASMPILANVLVEAKQGQVRLAATNLEVGIEALAVAAVGEAGSVTLPHRILAEMIADLSDDEAPVVFVVDGTTATITHGRSKFTLMGMPAADFPSMPEYDAEGSTKIDSGLLRSMLRQTHIAASTDDTRPFLTGVYLHSDGETLRAAATDGGRLAVRSAKLAGSPMSAIIPGSSVAALLKVVPDEAEAEVVMQQNQAVFTFPGVRVLTRLIAGTFPDYARIIPRDGKTRLTFGAESMLRAVKRASVTARGFVSVVKLTVEGGSATLESNTADVGAARESLDATAVGEDMVVAFNSKFLQDALSVVDSPDATLDLTGQLSPMALRAGADYVYVLAPIRAHQ